MDDFVLLTERYGLKPQVKSAPMAELKRSVNPNNGGAWHFDDVNVEFSIASKFDGGGFDDFVVKLSSKNSGYDAGYLFAVMPESISSSINVVDDLLGDFSGFDPAAKSWNQNSSEDLGKNEDGFDELIPGFGASVQPSNSAATTWSVTPDDPFEVIESTSAHSSSRICVDSLKEFATSTSSSQASTKLEFLPIPTQETQKVSSSSRISSVDELADFAIDTLRCSSLDSDNASIYRETEAVEAKKQQFGADDLSPLFGVDPSHGEFEEFPGESDKRRMARWEREQRIKNQVANAIADMNSRDRQIQIEQEERSRISDTLDAEIKLWAAGKEGNIRALLSSLHLVLWPGCGWEAVSLTDLITSAAVKKVYKKANLYVHPDKVQQKGAQQKYIAEKIFNILKEAWNKFNKEELS